MTEVVGRLAPSPTGAQHIGNARTFLLAWLSIRSRNGRIILRMEDIDSPRIKLWAVDQALADLRWLGLNWDEGPDLGGPQGPYTQTQRADRYAKHFQQLKRADAVYPCTCTRSDVLTAASAPNLGDEPPAYSGTCASRTAAEAGSIAEPYCWRFRTAGALPDPAIYEDEFRGTQARRLAGDLGDFVVARANGAFAYQLAVVIDDHEMGITEVLRGDDLVSSTFRQLALYQFFDWQPPRFAHVPLVVGPDGRRLAKRHGDTRLSLLRERGVRPQTLIGFLAHASGLIDRFEPVAATDLVAGFNPTRIDPRPLVFRDESWPTLLNG